MILAAAIAALALAAQQAAPEILRARMEQADALARAGRLDEALAAYRGIAADFDGHWLALYGIGLIHLRRDQLQEAKTALQQSLEGRPDAIEPRFMLGETLLQLQEYQSAARELGRVVRDQPDHHDAQRDLGVVLIELGPNHYDDGIAALRRAVALAPANPHDRISLGRALERTEQFELALREYARAAELAPERAETWYYLGRLQWQQGELAAAEGSLRRCLGLEPDHALAHFALGNVLRRLGRRDQALAELRRHQQLQPGRGERSPSGLSEQPEALEARIERGRELFQQGAHAEAQATLLPVLRVCGAHLPAATALLTETIGAAATRAALEHALPGSPCPGAIESQLGILAIAGGDPQSARRHFEAAVELSAADPTPAYNLANLDYLGRLERLVTDHPSYVRGHFLLGMTAGAAGQPDRAVNAFRAALELAPDQRATYMALARLLDQLGRAQEADEVRRRMQERFSAED
jgi:tetratricopeptide (TPR) repeat protein